MLRAARRSPGLASTRAIGVRACSNVSRHVPDEKDAERQVAHLRDVLRRVDAASKQDRAQLRERLGELRADLQALRGAVDMEGIGYRKVEPRENAEEVRYEVHVDRSGGASLGLQGSRSESGKHFTITSIQPEGLLHRWNRAKPWLCLSPGDRLVEANGISGSVPMMVGELKKHKRLKLVFVRAARGRGAQSRKAWRPTVAQAVLQPRHVAELDHQPLAELAMHDSHNAHRERLIREIMAVDNVTWHEAHFVLAKMDEDNELFYKLESMPYRVGVFGSLLAAFVGSILVFYHPSALWYADHIVGEELPEGVNSISEMTTNQVGTWTWQWMEPMIGTASFILLCFQFARGQAMTMNMKTYAEMVLHFRAGRLSTKFPQYDRSMVRAWSKHFPKVSPTFAPQYERFVGYHGPTSGL